MSKQFIDVKTVGVLQNNNSAAKAAGPACCASHCTSMGGMSTSPVKGDEEYFVVSRGATKCSDQTQLAPSTPTQLIAPVKTIVENSSAYHINRSLLSRGKGKMNKLHTLLPYSLTFSSVGAAPGIITTVQTIYADNNATEWAAFAAVFDEYRVLGGRLHYSLDYVSRAIPAGGYTMDDNFVMCYDPLNGVALTGVRQGTEVQNHRLSMSRFEAGVIKTWANQPVRGLSLGFKTPSDGVLANTAASAVDAAPGSWKKIFAAGSNGPDGYFRSYGVTGFVTTVVAVNAIVVLDIEFRIRL